MPLCSLIAKKQHIVVAVSLTNWSASILAESLVYVASERVFLVKVCSDDSDGEAS